jgi:uncharacterized membrane protein
MKARAAAIALIAFLGMVDTFYLSLKRNQGPVPCRVTSGCNDVLTSKYSEIAGIPLSSIGLVFYIGVFCAAVFELFGTAKSLPWLFYPAGIALLISGLLVGIQAFSLRAFCEYCLLSSAFVLAIFFLIPRPNPN